jgi:excisionase family DNA binding protein
MLSFRSMNPKLLSTVEVARKVGVPRATLQYWIKEGKIAAPKTKLRNGVAVRLWTPEGVEEAKNLKGSLKRGPEPKKGKKSKA